MEDRELLELAAKAAGFGAPSTGNVCWTESEYPRRSGLHGALWNYVGHMDTAELWNPLADDGDALRLAVKLTLLLDIGPTEVVTITDRPNAKVISNKTTDSANDMFAVTRRAIVLAAAEIGKGM